MNKNSEENHISMEEKNKEKNSKLIVLKTAIQHLKNFFYPLKKSETFAGWVLAIIFTLKIFVYSTTRLVKDNLVVATLGGAVIPFIKMVVSFAAIFFAGLYLFGISHFNRRQLFHITLAFFMIFFAFFGFVLSPYKDYFILSDMTVAGYISWLGGNTGAFIKPMAFLKIYICTSLMGLLMSVSKLKARNIIKNISIFNILGFAIYSLLYFLSSDTLATKMNLPIQILKLWPYSCYYVFSELWGGYALQMLFWNFANHQVTPQESANVYPFVILIGQIGQIGAGYLVEYCVIGTHLIPVVSVATLAAGLGIAMLHEYLFHHTKRESNDTVVVLKEKPSFTKSLKAMSSSPVVLGVAVIILFYGLSCSILETYWKIRLNNLAAAVTSTPEAAKQFFSIMQSKMFVAIGYASVISALLSGVITKRIGWTFAALVTPVTLAVGTLLFYGLDIGSSYFNNLFHGGNILYVAMIIGLVILVFLKATKYTLFDNTKEMLLVALHPAIKNQSKVADTVAGRLGKPAAGVIFTVAAIVTNNISNLNVRIFMFMIIMIITIFWIIIVIRLGKIRKENQLNEQLLHKQKEKPQNEKSI
jgi:AAA family ATP:ADP antiporter